MIKSDPIIAVKDVAQCSKWYQALFDCKGIHGGDEFEVLVSEANEVILCLHAWEAHGHPTMTKPTANVGNGLILYFRAKNLTNIRMNAEQLGARIEKEIEINPNSGIEEFALRDPDGYYLIISSYHEYQG